MSLFERFVEVGRVVMLQKEQQLGVIVEVIDHGRLLVDGICARQQVSLKQCQLTPIKLDIPRGIKTKNLKLKLDKQDLLKKWMATSWYKKIQKCQKRQGLSDFDRFKVMCARKKQSTVVGKKFKTLKKK